MDRVLIVDDEPLMCWVLASAFEQAGYPTRSAQSVAEAAQVLREDSIGLIVTDFDLKDGCGCHVADHAFEANPMSVVILVSANPDADQHLCTKRGIMSSFVRKPFEVEQILEQAGALLEKVKSHAIPIQH